jgi:hypothetical protein
MQVHALILPPLLLLLLFTFLFRPSGLHPEVPH